MILTIIAFLYSILSEFRIFLHEDLLSVDPWLLQKFSKFRTEVTLKTFRTFKNRDENVEIDNNNISFFHIVQAQSENIEQICLQA